MNLFHLHDTLGDLRRFREIAGVLFEEGLSFVLDEAQIHYLVPWKSRLRGWRHGRFARGFGEFGMQLDPPAEVRLRRSFERLGPSFIKLGQVMSMRPDLVPESFCRELAKLQDRVPPLMPGMAEKIVERALGAPVENLFATFEERPTAAASLSVVHRATLRDGREVAVKIRRPGVEQVLKNDIHIMAKFARLIEASVPESRRLGPVRFVAEFADWTMRELDFELEGANMDRFRAAFKDDPSLVVPTVHWDLTRREVLTMDYIEGIKIDDFAALERAGIDRRELALVGLRTGIRQFFVEGFFHADPHPGNLVAVPPYVDAAGERTGGPVRVCLYDFGMTGSLSTKSRYELLSCFMSFVNKDIDGYTQHILDIGEPGPQADADGFIRSAKRIITDVLYKPNERKGVASALYRIIISGARYDIFFPSDLILMGKAFFTLENVGLALYPDIDLDDVLRPFLSELLKQELSPERALKELQSSAFDRLYFLKHLPDQTRAMLDRLERGQVGVRLDFQELHDLKAEFDRQNDARILAFLAVAMVVGSAVMARLDVRLAASGWPVGEIGFVIAGVVIIWLLVVTRRRPRP
jgi:ubiquinone biosynthesis protein